MKEKVCTKCNLSRPLSDFYKSGIRYEAECKFCRRERSRQYHIKNSDEQNRKKRAYRSADPKKHREYEVRRAYNLSPEQYYAILESQDNKCVGCLREFGEEVLPHIDHDHSCCPQARGTCGHCIRGILCNTCNRGLGCLKDSPEIMNRLARYILNYEKDGNKICV